MRGTDPTWRRAEGDVPESSEELGRSRAKSLPRNADGSVTIFGVITLPASVVGERPPDVVEPSLKPEPSKPEPSATTPGAPTRAQLEGVWLCNRNSHAVIITFTETGRVTLRSPVGNTYQNTAFATWNDEPYMFVSQRTIKVGGNEANLELGEDGQALRIFGGQYIFECEKDTFQGRGRHK